MLVDDLRQFFSLPPWDENAFLALLTRYDVTPEMFFDRLSELIPTFLELPQLQQRAALIPASKRVALGHL